MMRPVRLSAAAVLVAALSAAACGEKYEPPVTAPAPPPPPAEETTPPPPPPPPPAPKPAPPPLTEEEIFARTSLEDLNAKRPLDDVFFGLDSVEISDEARAILQKNAQWMGRWVSTRSMIEGHADARGTNEYNLALGERRAVAIRNYLVSLGVPADRLQTVSKGEEQPFCQDESESCWQQNRRGHFILTAK